MNTRALLLGVALVAMSSTYLLPSSAQGPVIQPCGNTTLHTYHIAGTFGATINGSFGGAGFVDAEDTCPAGTANPDDFDNDYDAAIGGGIFYASSTCGPAPGSSAAPQTPGYSWSPHHAHAPGSAYTATQNGPGIVAYTVGTDGEIIDPTNNTIIPCTGNNIVSDDEITDPTDCGQGDTGISPNGPSATIGINNATYTSCNPADGYVAAFMAYGPIIPCNPPPGDACITIYSPCDIPEIPDDFPNTLPEFDPESCDTQIIEQHIDPTNAFISTPTWGDITG